MRRRCAIADVFTGRMFSGNPVAVVLDAEGLTAAGMQAIAVEFDQVDMGRPGVLLARARRQGGALVGFVCGGCVAVMDRTLRPLAGGQRRGCRCRASLGPSAPLSP